MGYPVADQDQQISRYYFDVKRNTYDNAIPKLNSKPQFKPSARIQQDSYKNMKNYNSNNNNNSVHCSHTQHQLPILTNHNQFSPNNLNYANSASKF